MTRAMFYLVVLVAFVAGLVAVLVIPELALVVLVVGVPSAIVSAVVSTAYLAHVFRRQQVPRSRFFRMLLETFVGLMIVGAWVGYLTVARVTERAVAAGVIDWYLPAPPPTVSSPISALVIIAVFSVPTRFAWEVWRRRRAAALDNTLDVDGTESGRLDRE